MWGSLRLAPMTTFLRNCSQRQLTERQAHAQRRGGKSRLHMHKRYLTRITTKRKLGFKSGRLKVAAFVAPALLADITTTLQISSPAPGPSHAGMRILDTACEKQEIEVCVWTGRGRDARPQLELHCTDAVAQLQRPLLFIIMQRVPTN